MKNDYLMNWLARTASDHPTTTIDEVLAAAVKRVGVPGLVLVDISDEALLDGLSMTYRSETLIANRPARSEDELKRLIAAITTGWDGVGDRTSLGFYMAGMINEADGLTQPQDIDSGIVHVITMDAQLAMSIRASVS